MRAATSHRGGETGHSSATTPTQSLSPAARLFYYRGPSRRIPSPTNILSIDRRDEEEKADDGGVYAVQPPLRRPTNNYTRAARTTAAGPTALQTSSAFWGRRAHDNKHEHQDGGRDEETAYYFYDPRWAAEEDAEAATSASPSPRIAMGETAPSLASTPIAHGSRMKTSLHALPPSQLRTAFRVSPPLLSSSPRPSGQQALFSTEEGASTPHDTLKTKDKECHVRHMPKRYQRCVGEGLQPQLEQLKAALQEKTDACARLRTDNVILTTQLQRLQVNHIDAASPTTSRSVSPLSPFSVPAPVPATHDNADTKKEEAARQLAEAAAEITLLKRQLAHVQAKHAYHQPQHVEDRTAMSPITPLHGAQEVEKDAAVRAELMKWCRVLSEDGLGFTKALSDVHERSSLGRSAHEVSSGRDGGASPLRSGNLLRAATEEWGRFARLVVSPALPTETSAAAKTEGNTLHAGDDLLGVCTTVLKALAATLRTEHSAVASSMEVLQQIEKQYADAISRHQQVVEQVRREAERRVEELEADHEAEVQALENAIAELEQQVNKTAASCRPWTAGLLIQRRIEAPPSISPNSSNTRSAHDVGGARRDSAVSGCGGGSVAAVADVYDTTRRSGVVDGCVSATTDRVEAETQTPLSLEWIQACLQKAREEPVRSLRREKEAELVELMSTAIETLRRQLTDSRAVATRLREQQRRFLGDVTLPLSYFDNCSSFPAYV